MKIQFIRDNIIIAKKQFKDLLDLNAIPMVGDVVCPSKSHHNQSKFYKVVDRVWLLYDVPTLNIEVKLLE